MQFSDEIIPQSTSRGLGQLKIHPHSLLVCILLLDPKRAATIIELPRIVGSRDKVAIVFEPFKFTVIDLPISTPSMTNFLMRLAFNDECLVALKEKNVHDFWCSRLHSSL